MPLNVGNLENVPFDQRGEVGVEERGTSASRPSDRLRKATDNESVQVVTATQRGRVGNAGPVREDRVYKAVGLASDFPLGERPEFDDLHAAWQGIGKFTQCKHAGRAGQQISAGKGVEIDVQLDRPQQLWGQLDLINDHQSFVLDEPRRIVSTRLQHGRVIRETHRPRCGQLDARCVVIWPLCPPARRRAGVVRALRP